MRTLPLSSSQNYCPSSFGYSKIISSTTQLQSRCPKSRGSIWAKQEEKGNKKGSDSEKSKQSLFSSVTEALDFSQVRSPQDAQLLEDATEATRSGKMMNREQYGALRRKIGGTYKDFFKSYIDVDGQYVEEGWVDKTCKICRQDTKGEPRQVDNLGRYVHVACLEKSKPGNFFTRLFSR